MKVTKVFFCSLALSLGLLTATPAQGATLININSRVNNLNNPINRFFEAGSYKVEYIGQAEGGDFNAWNAWSLVTGCDINGENCTLGWLNFYQLSSSEFSINVGDTSVDRFATDIQALSNASDTSFTLTSDANVSFFIGDIIQSDNSGGVSLRVSAVTDNTSIPEFNSNISLVALSILSITSNIKRKQKPFDA